MEIVCFDMEGTLTPEIWEKVACNTGIEEFNKTTRDIPDYGELMDFRLDIMKANGLKLSDIKKASNELDLLPGAESFLANIRETDAIAHVIRCFENDDITHVAGKIDPISDIQTINTELLLSDLAIVEKSLARLKKLSKTGNKEIMPELKVIEKIEQELNLSLIHISEPTRPY